ncbi:SLBB domain-containing protein, partial [bacterium]|nr:SLBB domain-containing protein [bacterium]
SKGIPLYQRVVTISGTDIAEPGNMMVRIGTPFSKVIEACGGAMEPIAKLISGGPMMGLAQSTDRVAVTKGTSGILLFESSKIEPETPCINCAKCVDACPTFLLPTRIAQAAEYGNFELAEKYGAMECIECGACAFICPSNRKLLQYIRLAKNEIRAAKAKEKAAKDA